MAKRKKALYKPAGIIERARQEIQAIEDAAVFAALDNAANALEPEPFPADEAGEPEAAIDEVEEIPPPLAVPEPERIVIHAQNGNDLYWNEVQNRWLIVGIPEEEQPAPPPRLRVEAAQAPLRFAQNQVVGRVDIGLDAPIYRTYTKLKEEKKSRGTEPMYFEDLSNQEKIDVMKREFITLLKSVFDNPESLKVYITNKTLSKEQAKQIFKNLHKLNANKCPCCRRFDSRLLGTPIDRELEPLIDIAQSTARSRSY
jgi:hypothetical protein